MGMGGRCHMKTRLMLIAVLAGIGGLAATQPHEAFRLIATAYAACEPGTPLDKTTIDEIRARLTKAGYTNPQNLRKGCDNTWHGTVTKDGAQINIAVTTDGHIVQEGD
jgi:hypothetical protein